jgi:hypothetical protein
MSKTSTAQDAGTIGKAGNLVGATGSGPQASGTSAMADLVIDFAQREEKSEQIMNRLKPGWAPTERAESVASVVEAPPSLRNSLKSDSSEKVEWFEGLGNCLAPGWENMEP